MMRKAEIDESLCYDMNSLQQVLPLGKNNL